MASSQDVSSSNEAAAARVDILQRVNVTDQDDRDNKRIDKEIFENHTKKDYPATLKAMAFAKSGKPMMRAGLWTRPNCSRKDQINWSMHQAVAKPQGLGVPPVWKYDNHWNAVIMLEFPTEKFEFKKNKFTDRSVLYSNGAETQPSSLAIGNLEAKPIQIRWQLQSQEPWLEVRIRVPEIENGQTKVSLKIPFSELYQEETATGSFTKLTLDAGITLAQAADTLNIFRGPLDDIT
jgi:hypothetical protein